MRQLKENEIYVVKDGKLKPVEKPPSGFGKTVIHWQNGKPVMYGIEYTLTE